MGYIAYTSPGESRIINEKLLPDWYHINKLVVIRLRISGRYQTMAFKEAKKRLNDLNFRYSTRTKLFSHPHLEASEIAYVVDVIGNVESRYMEKAKFEYSLDISTTHHIHRLAEHLLKEKN